MGKDKRGWVTEKEKRIDSSFTFIMVFLIAILIVTLIVAVGGGLACELGF